VTVKQHTTAAAVNVFINFSFIFYPWFNALCHFRFAPVAFSFFVVVDLLSSSALTIGERVMT
jgi:hypothetical protein